MSLVWLLASTQLYCSTTDPALFIVTFAMVFFYYFSMLTIWRSLVITLLELADLIFLNWLTSSSSLWKTQVLDESSRTWVFLHHFLGIIKVHRSAHILFLCQTHYALNFLDHAHATMNFCKPISTPKGHHFLPFSETYLDPTH